MPDVPESLAEYGLGALAIGVIAWLSVQLTKGRGAEGAEQKYARLIETNQRVIQENTQALARLSTLIEGQTALLREMLEANRDLWRELVRRRDA